MASKYTNMTLEQLEAEVKRREAEARAVIQPGLPQVSEAEYSAAAPSQASLLDRLMMGAKRGPEEEINYLVSKYKTAVKRGPKPGQYLLLDPNQDANNPTAWWRFREDPQMGSDPFLMAKTGTITPPKPMATDEDIIKRGLGLGAGVAAMVAPPTIAGQAAAAGGAATLKALAEQLVPGESSQTGNRQRAAEIAGSTLIGGGLAAIGKGIGGIANRRASENAIKTVAEREANPAAQSVDEIARERLAAEAKVPGAHLTPGDLGSPSGQAIEGRAARTPKYEGALEAQADINQKSVRDLFEAQKPPGKVEDLQAAAQKNWETGLATAEAQAPGHFNVKKVISDLDEIIREQEQVNAPVARLKSMRERLLSTEGQITARDMANELKGVTALGNTNLEGQGAKKAAISRVKGSLNDVLREAQAPLDKAFSPEELRGIPAGELAKRLKAKRPMAEAASTLQEMRAEYAQAMRPIDQIKAVDQLLADSAVGKSEVIDPNKFIKNVEAALHPGKPSAGIEPGALAEYFGNEPEKLDKFLAGLKVIQAITAKGRSSGASQAEQATEGFIGNKVGVSAGVAIKGFGALKSWWHRGYLKAALGDKVKRDAIVTLGTGPVDAAKIANVLTQLGISETD